MPWWFQEYVDYSEGTIVGFEFVQAWHPDEALEKIRQAYEERKGSLCNCYIPSGSPLHEASTKQAAELAATHILARQALEAKKER